MYYLMTLTKLMEISLKRSCHLLIIVYLVKKVKIKGVSENWYDAEIMEKISDRDKLFKKIKSIACMSIKVTISKHGMR